MDKAIKSIHSVKDIADRVEYYIRDLNAWEHEMKQKEAALNGEQVQQVQELPPVRSKQRREKFQKNKKRNSRKRPAVTNYQAWDKFDPDKANEEMEDVGPLSLSLDHKQSEVIKQIKLKEEAHYQKERGNKFVKVERWDDAITCYNRAIELVKDDAIYYANRGFCYLKKESLHQAEADCTKALSIDPSYVKALQRRATAREKLGSLRAATQDLAQVIRLEPNNAAAKRQLESIKQRMGTKGRKAKSSPLASPSQPTNPTGPLCNPLIPSPKTKIVDLPQAPPILGQNAQVMTQNAQVAGPNAQVAGPNAQAVVGQKSPRPNVGQRAQVPQGKLFGVPQASQLQPNIQPTPIKKVELNNDNSLDNWKNGVGENVLVIKPVKKPPHLRSKRALKTIPIKEIPLGKASAETEKPSARMKIVEIDSQDFANNNSENDNNEPENNNQQQQPEKVVDTENSTDLKNDEINDNVKIEPIMSGKKFVPPNNSVQFMSEWRNLKGDNAARYEYLSLLEPAKIPKVFSNALESSVLSQVLQALHERRQSRRLRVADYLAAVTRVQRFSTLAMFLSATDKDVLNKLLVFCKTVENCSEDEISELKKKYELN